MTNPRFRSTILFLSFVALFIFLQLFRLPFTPILFEGDHLVHMSNAWRMYLGESAFQDFFLFTFPGTEIYFFILYKIFGVQQWLLNATIFLLLMSLSAVGLYFSRKLLTGWAVYLPVSMFAVIGIRQFGIDGSHRFFSVLFVLIAVAVIFSQRTSLRLFLAGVFCGLAALFTQPRGLVGLAAIVIFLLIEKFYEKQAFLDFFKSVLIVTAPFALIIGFTLIYFITTAGFENFYYSTFVFPIKHYPADDWNNFNAYLKDLPVFGTQPLVFYTKQTAPILFYYLLIPAIYFIFGIIYWFRRSKIADEKKLQLIFINLIGLFLAVGIFSAPSVGRLYQISIPGLISLIWIIQTLIPNQKLMLAFSGVLFLLGLSYSVQRQTVPVISLSTPSGQILFFSKENYSRYKWTADNTQPLDYFYEPHHPTLYTIFRLKNPTAISLIRPNNYTPERQVNEIISGLERHQPRYIIWNSLWNDIAEKQSPGFNLQPLIDYLKLNYHFSEKLNDYSDNQDFIEYKVEIWERNK